MPFDTAKALTDARDLRALSHPLRLRLLELLDDGPVTATEAAAALNTTPANCSFHLRLLARHGFVTEAAGGAGRQRPWRLVEQEYTVAGSQLSDEEGRLAFQALTAVVDERHRQRIAAWRRSRYGYPEEWQAAATETFAEAHLTAAELAEITGSIHDILRPYLTRARAARPAGAVPVDIHLSAVPRRQPEELR